MKHKGWYCRKYLPHLDTPEQIQSITFRLNDALPRQVVEHLKKDGENGLITDLEKRTRIENYLDAGHGHCWLKQPSIANLVENAFFHFDKQHYLLLAWCIMPNHIHVLIKTKTDHPLHKIIHSWKSYTAKEANKQLGCTGVFWQRDYYDRYIRNDRHFAAVCEYIENNSVKAGLVTHK